MTYVNDIFAHSMGYIAENMYGMYHKDLCLPQFVNSPDYEKFWQALLSGKSFQDKIERMDSKGNTIWLEATYMPVFDEQNEKVLSISKVATDITERIT